MVEASNKNNVPGNLNGSKKQDQKQLNTGNHL